jgi:uncharacterized membrane protein
VFNTLKSLLKASWEHFFKTALQGLFYIAPIVAITAIIWWLYKKVDFLTGKLFELFGFNPENFLFLWTLVGLGIVLGLAYVVGGIVETRIGDWFERILNKIPGFKTLKDLINIFNSSKSGEQQVLVVMIRGFANQGYNIGLMYSRKESIVKDHYTVTLSQTPLPNGGYLFEVHKDNIWVIKEANFDHNLQYLLSMGVKSLPEIIKVEPRELENLPSLVEFLASDNHK